MQTVDGIISFIRSGFGVDWLVTLPEGLGNSNPPSREREFLRTVGLPKKEVLLLSFSYTTYGLRLLEEVAIEPRIDWKESAQDWVVGGCDYALICIGSQDHTIWEVDPMQVRERRFANSDLVRFVGCLAAYEEYTSASANENHSRLVDRLEQRLKSIDTPALIDNANYWSLVLQDASLLDG
jgi:hypothetical protein